MIKVNGIELQTGTFPNGEKTYIKNSIIVKRWEVNVVEYRFTDNASLMDLYFVMQHIKKGKRKYMATKLLISYMPYSRMDRDNKDYFFTLEYLQGFFRSLGVVDITIIEPHSEATIDMLNEIPGITAKGRDISLDLAEKLIKDKKLSKELLIVLPDAGASKRYGKDLNSYTFRDLPNVGKIIMDKVRDFTTGKIISIDFARNYYDSYLIGKDAIIVDDLCSRGGTFIGTAKKLKERGVQDIYLVVAHAEKTILQGAIPTSDLIKEVWTTNTIIQSNKGIEKIKILDASHYLLGKDLEG